MPRCDIRYIYGSITWARIISLCPSYINAVLIQKAGTVIQPRCIVCRRRRGLYLFLECRRVLGHFGGAYGNCKWHDHASRCSCRDAESSDEESSSESDSDLGQNPLEQDRPVDDGRVEVQILYNPFASVSVVFIQY